MKVLGVSGEEQKALWLILGAIYHLGAAGATKGRDSQQIPSASHPLVVSTMRTLTCLMLQSVRSQKQAKQTLKENEILLVFAAV